MFFIIFYLLYFRVVKNTYFSNIFSSFISGIRFQEKSPWCSFLARRLLVGSFCHGFPAHTLSEVPSALLRKLLLREVAEEDLFQEFPWLCLLLRGQGEACWEMVPHVSYDSPSHMWANLWCQPRAGDGKRDTKLRSLNLTITTETAMHIWPGTTPKDYYSWVLQLPLWNGWCYTQMLADNVFQN